MKSYVIGVAAVCVLVTFVVGPVRLPTSFVLFALVALVYAVATDINVRLGKRRRSTVEASYVARGGTRNHDGSFTFNEDGFELLRTTRPTGVATGAGEVPVHVMTTVVRLDRADSPAGFIHIVVRSGLAMVPVQRELEAAVGSARRPALLCPLGRLRGWEALGAELRDEACARALLEALVPVLRRGKFMGWPATWMDLLPSGDHCELRFFACDSPARIAKPAVVARIDAQVVEAGRRAAAVLQQGRMSEA